MCKCTGVIKSWASHAYCWFASPAVHKGQQAMANVYILVKKTYLAKSSVVLQPDLLHAKTLSMYMAFSVWNTMTHDSKKC